MKTIFVALSIQLMFFSSFTFKNEPPAKVKIKTSAICEMCKARIEKKLAFTKGIIESDLDLKDKVITVTYQSNKTDISKIKNAINEAGYDADETKAIEKSYEKLPSCCKKETSPH